MVSPRPDGPARPTDPDPAAPPDRGRADRIVIHCPNPDCRKRFKVPQKYAGRKARCSLCGTPTEIPATAAPVVVLGPSAPALPVGREVAEVRVGCIGRGHAGKTALFHALGGSVAGGAFLRSGLHVDAADPRDVARMIREAEEAERNLRRTGLPPTTVPTAARYALYGGDQPLVDCRLREVIGQVLTHTLPDSDPAAQARYAEYLRTLVDAHVLWAVVPCPPPDPAAQDRRRFAYDLRITQAYLREALRLRANPRPAAVALVLTKTDTLYPDRAAARAVLTDEVLRRALDPLVQLVERSDRVADAAVVPVSAFGYGKAVRREGGGEREGAPVGSVDEPFGGEPIWLLKAGEAPRPDNVDLLFLWSLLLGLMNQGATGPEADAVGRVWRDDLDGRAPWLIPIKGGVALSGSADAPKRGK